MFTLSHSICTQSVSHSPFAPTVTHIHSKLYILLSVPLHYTSTPHKLTPDHSALCPLPMHACRFPLCTTSLPSLLPFPSPALIPVPSSLLMVLVLVPISCSFLCSSFSFVLHYANTFNLAANSLVLLLSLLFLRSFILLSLSIPPFPTFTVFSEFSSSPYFSFSTSSCYFFLYCSIFSTSSLYSFLKSFPPLTFALPNSLLLPPPPRPTT